MNVMRRINQVVRGRRDAGIALPTVIGLCLVMLIMVAGSLTAVTGGMLRTNTSEDLKAAMAAAYAGVGEYQSRLSNDATYYKFGNPSAAFSATSATSLSLPTGTNKNDAFGNSTSDAWAVVPNADGSDSGARFRYQVDNSDYATKGVIRLQSTGKVGNVTATLVADLRQTGFIDFLYFTDFETSDPLLSATYKNQTDANGNNVCARYAWATPTRPSGCGNIQFAAFDTLQGPVHSNDTLDICGATFTGAVTTADPRTPNYENDNGCPSATFKVGTGPTTVSKLSMPLTNASMPKETVPDTPATVPNPGCLYTGPTTIQFSVVAGAGMMRVWSPYTRHTEVTSTGGNGPDPAKCGAISDLQSTAGALIPVLDLNLVYVQSVPAGSTDPNYWASNATPANLTCINVTQGSQVSGGFSFGSIRYPSANELLPASSTTDNPAYSCRSGDLYVSGVLKGRTTLAAKNYVYATGDITYSDPSSDILGLVAENSVWAWNPIVCSKTLTTDRWGNLSCPGTWGYGNSDADPTISGAILSVQHTFMAQNYDGGSVGLGARGTLTVNGAIAQKFRGTVATGGLDRSGNYYRSTGYAKSYTYDDRLKNTAPPKFLTPVSTTYGVTQFSGVSPAYSASGAPQ
jgi:Tfp pilus assembly protein PilX